MHIKKIKFKSLQQLNKRPFSKHTMTVFFFPSFFLLYSLWLSVTAGTPLFPWPAARSPKALKAKTKPWECPLHSPDNNTGAPVWQVKEVRQGGG